MPGKKKAVIKGNELRDNVIELAKKLKLEYRKEVRAGRRIYGKKRKIDVVLRHPGTGKVLGIECKFQDTPGTAEEKIVATIEDIKHWPIHGIVVIAGKGFSSEMIGYLMSTGKVVTFQDLEDWLKLYFNL